MPRVNIQGVGMVNFPDTMSAQEIEHAIETDILPTPKKSAYTPINATDEMSQLERGVAGFGKSFVDTGRGIGQLLGLVDQNQIDEAKHYDAPLMDTTAGTLGNVAGGVAQAVAIPGGATVKGAMLAGGALAGAQPVATGESRALNTAIGTGAAGVGQGVAKGIGVLARGPKNVLTPAERELAAKAEALGIDLSPAQKTGNKFLAAIDTSLEKMPATSGTQTAKRVAQGKQYTAAVTRTFGNEADNIGEGTMAAAKGALGKEYEQLFEHARIPMDSDVLLGKLVAVNEDAGKFLSDQQAKIVANRIDDLLAKVEADGAVAGKAYQKWRSGVKSSDGDVNHYLKQVKLAVDEAAGQALGPEKMAAFAATNTKYKNMKTVEPLAAKSTNGQASPGALLQRVAAANPNMAYTGAGEIGDVAKIGHRFIKEPIGDSGTAQRLMAQALLTGGMGGGVWGATGDPGTALQASAGTMGATILAPKLAQALLNRPAVQKYLAHGGAKPEEMNQLLIELLKRSSGGLPVAGAIAAR